MTEPATRHGRRAPLLVVTCAFATMLCAANLATPLYAGYRQRFGFDPAVLSLVFAVYALVLIPALLMFGQLSDRFGRRRVIVAGLGTATGGLGLFAAAHGVAWLFAARSVQGLGQGMMSGAATAALVELTPGGHSRAAAIRASLAQAGGAAFGVLLAGVLARWTSAPYVTPFAAGAALLLAAAVGMRLVPETASPGRGPLRPQRPGVPREIRAPFARVAITAAATWAVAASLFLSVMPAYASPVLHTGDVAWLGAVSALMLACSCLGQLAVRRGTPPAATQAGGLALLACGLLALVLAQPLHQGGLLIAGAALAGVGHGVAFLAAQDDLTHLAPDERRAEVSAAFYVCIYLGVAVPVIGVGVVATVAGLFTAVATFAAVTGTAALAVAAWHLRHRENRGPAAPARHAAEAARPPGRPR
ncbi:MFS transporter [Streptacidiphilus monticola]|uniref:MFS transporter n=1 Tax=Streptacidiphilus monticola TaxID=2161674 RepID=A0ABW1FXT7_9ACTN